MNDLDRRRFLQAASLAVAGGYANFALGKSPVEMPKFAANPTFKPRALFLTWHRDPTSTMTVQWIGAEADAAARPVWFAAKGGIWQSQGHTTRRFPRTDHYLHRAELTGLKPD